MSSISHGAPQKRRIIPNPGLWLAIIAGIIITLLPLGDTLPVAGQNMIAILVFAIIVWISEAMDYTASAIVISALIIFMVGFAPDMNHPDTILGTAKALKMTLSGFSNSALALVAAAMFIAAAMTITGLDKRIALFTMSKIGASSPQHYYRCHCGDHRPEPGRTQCHCPYGLRGADYDGGHCGI